jgi:hypothetical protein
MISPFRPFRSLFPSMLHGIRFFFAILYRSPFFHRKVVA